MSCVPRRSSPEAGESFPPMSFAGIGLDYLQARFGVGDELESVSYLILRG